jgi:septum formation protein
VTFSKVNLASASPRRKELLSKLINNFSILKVDFVEPDESEFSHPEDYIRTCVDSKVAQVFSRFEKDLRGELALVADTTVFLKGRLLGKPQTPKEATEMLQELSGHTHQVFTGYWLGPISGDSFDPKQIKWDISTVGFKKLSPAMVRDYVRSKEPMDKAGAYGFQGLALQFIQSVEGSYSNIMGLPILKIKDELKKWIQV